MVSSDLGKLEARRHWIFGCDCAIAGADTAPAARPTVAFFRNARRFIFSLQRTGFTTENQEQIDRIYTINKIKLNNNIKNGILLLI